MKHCLLIFTVLMVSSCHSPKKSSGHLFNIDPFQYASQKKVVCENGVVVSAHPLASKVGLEILKQGGNSFDAAIAMQLVLAVVYPAAGNLGGGGFMVARTNDGKLIALDYREMAPGRAHRDMYIDENGNARTDKSQYGHLSSGVPGTVAGLFVSYKYAKLPFEKLIQPAIELAEKGFVIGQREANSLNNLQDELKQYNSVMPVFVRNETLPAGRQEWNANDVLIQKDLAQTLIRIRDKEQAGFYEGKTARLIIKEMKRGGGIITLDDLKNYTAKFRVPHVFDYKGYKIVSMPMPSSGGLLLHQMMKMIEKRNIASMGFHSVQAVQLMAEVERRAFADRAQYMGDADFFKVPVKELISEKYLDDRMKDYDTSVAGSSKDVQAGNTSFYESEETTHLAVMDKDGNAVAVTTTLNNSYGSKTVVGGAGFFMNDEMDDFSIKPGVPNMFGAIGGEANSIMPGKRMLSSMTPTIVLKDNYPYLIVGTPGGTTIPTSVFQTILNIIEFGMSTEDAVYKPKFHHQWLPDTLDIEKGFPEEIKIELQKKGYAIKQRSSIGRTEVIRILFDNPSSKPRFEAVADIRGDDSAEGW